MLGPGEEGDNVPAFVRGGGVKGIDGAGSDSAGRMVPEHALDHTGTSVGHGDIEVDDGGGVVVQEEVGHRHLVGAAGCSKAIHAVVALAVEEDEVIEATLGGDLGDVTTPDSGACDGGDVVGTVVGCEIKDLTVDAGFVGALAAKRVEERHGMGKKRRAVL